MPILPMLSSKDPKYTDVLPLLYQGFDYLQLYLPIYYSIDKL